MATPANPVPERRFPAGVDAAGVALALVLAAWPGTAAPPDPPAPKVSSDEIVLTIPEATVQDLLDRASPLEGSTPSGIDYRIDDPKVTIRGGHILTHMAIEVSGGVSLLGQTLAVSLDGTLEGEFLVRVDGRRRTIVGRMEIRKLSIRNLEDLSDTDDLKAFLSDNLTSFEYPLDLPTAELEELKVLLTGTITGIEIGEGKVLVRSRLQSNRMHRRAER